MSDVVLPSWPMALFSDTEIADLIDCPKQISDPPARSLRLIGADWRNDAKMVALDGTSRWFAIFMRQNEDFPENFSVGLRFQPNDGRPEITLLRCNGKHGAFTVHGDIRHPHWTFHIHRATEQAQDAGFTAEKYATTTDAFASYEQALQFFIGAVHLQTPDCHLYFPNSMQSKLFN